MVITLYIYIHVCEHCHCPICITINLIKDDFMYNTMRSCYVEAVTHLFSPQHQESNL